MHMLNLIFHFKLTFMMGGASIFLFCQNGRLARPNWHVCSLGDSEGAHRAIFGQQTRLRSYGASHTSPNRQLE